MRALIIPNDVIVHPVGGFMKFSDGRRPGTLKPGSNKVVVGPLA